MRLILLISLIFSSVSLSAEEHTIGQKNKMFTQKELHIKTGDTVHFLNQDNIFHNVFSLSDTKFFDLGSYPRNESRPVIFEKPGKIEVECAIHPQMYMVVKVED